MLIRYCIPSASRRQAMRAWASRCQSASTSDIMPSASPVRPRQSSMSMRAWWWGATASRQRASTALRSGPVIEKSRQARTISAFASSSRPLVESASASRSEPMPVCGGWPAKKAKIWSGGWPEGICRSPARRSVASPGQSPCPSGRRRTPPSHPRRRAAASRAPGRRRSGCRPGAPAARPPASCPPLRRPAPGRASPPAPRSAPRPRHRGRATGQPQAGAFSGSGSACSPSSECFEFAWAIP